MIPIIYEKDEIAFTSNGLGRLRDCISAVVTEERNGVYELDFEYPVTGANYDLIQLGRIIAVTHDDTGDVQPFDIVSYEKPIDGIVNFHCTHISYRQSYMTVKGTSGWGSGEGSAGLSWSLPINNVIDAITMLTAGLPDNPFIYITDKTNSGYLACADGTPRTVREITGGIEGSILDAYGGELEYDKWIVYLRSARGQYRDFTIRYGVNMLGYNDETDLQGTYSNCIPYWTDGENFVIGDMQTSGATLTARGECVPLDVSDKFESQPTKAQVESMGLSVMNENNTTMPAQNITVSFVRLQDTEEYAGYQNLLQCGLCDTINVIFEGTQALFKIVKTTWDVLENKYTEMELGHLATTLSEALGISNSLERSGGGSSPLVDDIEYEDFSSVAFSNTQGTVGGYNTAHDYDITKSGYTPIAISMTRNGHPGGYHPLPMILSDTTARVLIWRTASNTASYNVGDYTFRVAYLKNA